MKNALTLFTAAVRNRASPLPSFHLEDRDPLRGADLVIYKFIQPSASLGLSCSMFRCRQTLCLHSFKYFLYLEHIILQCRHSNICKIHYCNYGYQHRLSCKLDPAIIFDFSLFMAHIPQSLRSVIPPLQMFLHMLPPLPFLTLHSSHPRLQMNRLSLPISNF